MPFNINKFGNQGYDNYASETMLKQFLVTSYLVVSQLKYKAFLLKGTKLSRQNSFSQY